MTKWMRRFAETRFWAPGPIPGIPTNLNFSAELWTVFIPRMMGQIAWNNWRLLPQLTWCYVWGLRLYAESAGHMPLWRPSIADVALRPHVLDRAWNVWKVCRRGMGTERLWARDGATESLCLGVNWVHLAVVCLLVAASIWATFHPTIIPGVSTAAFVAPVFRVNINGSDSNAGAFDTNGTVATNGVATNGTTATPSFHSATYTFVNADIGHYLFIKAGTNWLPGWYPITGISSGDAVLDAAVGHVLLYTGVAPSGPGSLNTVAGCVNSTYAGAATGQWTVDYSQKDAAIFSFTDMLIQATTTQFTSSAHPVGPNFVGNVINVTSGTSFTVQRVYVVSVSGTTATCDKSLGTNTGTADGHGAFGGAYASIGQVGAVLGSVQAAVFIQGNNTYSITSATTNIAGGCFSIGNNSATRFEGFLTYPGDMGTPPIFQASGISTATLVANSGTTAHCFRNFTVDGAGLTSIQGYSTVANINVKVHTKNCTNSGISSLQNNYYFGCSATGCSSQPAIFLSSSSGNTIIYGCASWAHTAVDAFHVNAGTYTYCLAANCTTGTAHGFNAYTSNSHTCINCTAYGCSGDGFHGAGLSSVEAWYFNDIAEANNNGYNSSTNMNKSQMMYCAAYNNTTANWAANLTKVRFEQGNITYSYTAFINAASNDFRLNTNPNGGGALSGKGWPVALSSVGATVTYNDIGAVQAQPYAPGIM